MGLTCFPLSTRLISRRLTADRQLSGILSLIGFVTPWPPNPFSALPPGNLKSTLALKLFQGRTSYLRVRLNFSAIHKSSATIATGVGSVLHGVLLPLQPATWMGHLVFGSAPTATPYSDSLSLQPPVLNTLSLLRTITRRTVHKSTSSHLNVL